MAPNQGAIIVSILNEQDVLVDQGRFDEAEKRLRQADAMLKESPDDKGNMVAYLHWCWGTYHRRKGQLKTALEEDQASVAAYRPRPGRSRRHAGSPFDRRGPGPPGVEARLG